MRDERDNMPDSLLYQVHQIGKVVHGYGLQLLKYLIPGADDDQPPLRTGRDRSWLSRGRTHRHRRRRPR